MLTIRYILQFVSLLMIVYAEIAAAMPTKADGTAEAAHESSALAPQSIETSIVCAGDIMLVGSAKPIIEQRGVDYPFDGMRRIIEAADLAIGNLEMPLATTGNPLPEKEFTFVGQPKLAEGIANAGFDVLALANNHMGDYGDDALLETLEVLSANNLRYCGAGPNLQAARLPAIVRLQNAQIAVLAYSKTYPFEFFAGETDPGTVNGIAEIFVPDIKSGEGSGLTLLSYPSIGAANSLPNRANIRNGLADRSLMLARTSFLAIIHMSYRGLRYTKAK